MSDTPAEPSAAQRWLRLAEEDLSAAAILLENEATAMRIVGFLSQQAAEKALKAGLLAASADVPKIHGLRQLHMRYPAEHSPNVDHDDLDTLDPWVIDGRYAADLPDLSRIEARDLLATAQRVVAAIRPHVE